MNKNLPTIPSICFLTLLVVLIIYYGAVSADIEPLPVQQVVVDRDGTPWGLYHTDLVALEGSDASISFAGEGIRSHVGQIIALQDGGWLVNKGAQSQFLIRAIRRANESAEQLYQNSSSLLRCDSSLYSCIPWGEVALQFERSFDGLEMEDGRFLLFNPAKSLVFLVSRNGVILDRITKQEYWFGAAALGAGRYIAANTKRQRIEYIVVTDNSLSIEKSDINLRELENGKFCLKWISKPIPAQQGFWITGERVTNRGYSEGDDDKTIKGLFMVGPEGSLVHAGLTYQDLAEFEGDDRYLYVTEFDKQEVKRFEIATGETRLLTSHALEEAFQRWNQIYAEGRSTLWRNMLFGLVGLLGCGVWVWRGATPIEQGARKSWMDSVFDPKMFEPKESIDLTASVGSKIESQHDLDIPLSRSGRLFDQARWWLIGGFAVFTLFMFWGFFLNSSPASGDTLFSKAYAKGQTEFIWAFFSLMVYVIYRLARGKPKRLRVMGQDLLWVLGDGRTFRFDPETLVYTKHAFADQNVYVTVKRSDKAVYETAIFNRHAAPIIQQGRHVNWLGMMRYQLSNNTFNAMVHCVFYCVILYTYIAMRF
ncbi:MAG: hypothetical protein HKN50_11960 [Gammaproteobacteria bacterium]|nr:hypothetical protein [Gammaproteobacteria bacterium]